MEELISFELLPTFEECYIVDNLKINRYLYGFRSEKKVNNITYEFKVHRNAVEIYANENGGMTFKTLCNVMQDKKVDETVIDKIQNVLKLFKPEMQEYVERKKTWEQKCKIHISI